MTPALLAVLLAAPPVDPPAADPHPDADRHAAAAGRIAADVQTLAAFGTRHTLAPQNVDAANWLRERLLAAGWRDVALEEFTVAARGGAPRGEDDGRTTRFNVVATKPGTTTPDEVVQFGAHYDSRNVRLPDADGAAPGADDNASGTAALLEVARTLADVETARTVRLVFYSGEELGLVGSRADAKRMAAERDAGGRRIVLLGNMDMVGHPMPAPKPGAKATAGVLPGGDPPGTPGKRVTVEHDTGGGAEGNEAASKAWADRLIDLCHAEGLSCGRGELYGTDYIPYEATGVVCVGLYDGADVAPFYHTAEDVPAVVDPDYTARIAAAAAALVKAAATP